MPPRVKLAAPAFARALAACRPSARSLVVTLFGDVVAPHGGAVWLGTLIRWLDGFAISERNARTALGRLVREGWLERRAHGRRSEFALSASGRRRTREASRRIYRAEAPPRRAHWSLLLLAPAGRPGAGVASRARLKSALRLLGFGELSPTSFVHPAANPAELEAVLREHGANSSALLLRAKLSPHPRATAQPRALLLRGFELRELSKQYRIFVQRIEPLLGELGAAPEPAQAFRARVLAVHEYRRVVLRDPQLPAELLPRGFAGTRARALLAALYKRTAGSGALFVRETGACARGPLRPPDAAFHRRFRQA